MKRVAIIADLHCGHIVGLTPPSYLHGQQPLDGPYDFVTKVRNKAFDIAAQVWAGYVAICKAIQPVHLLIVNGDCVEGLNDKNGGAELAEPDVNVQVKMAAECIRQVGAQKTAILYGTPYHTSNMQDGMQYENNVAQIVKADHVGAHDWPEVEGVIFDVKHFISKSAVPYGRSTAIRRAAFWNMVWADRGAQPRGSVVVRSHVHYFDFSGDARRLGVITPALQGMGTRFGKLICEGTVDIGVLTFDCENREFDGPKFHAIDAPAQIATTTKF